MKIAICFSGMIRTGVYASANIKKYIGNLYDSVDFFMHTWNTSEDKKWHTESQAVREGRTQTLSTNNGVMLAQELRKVYDNKIISTEIEEFDNWYTNFGCNYVHFSPQWYSWHKSIELKKQHELENSFEYDVVIKMRPDIIYPLHNSLKEEINELQLNRDIFYAIGFCHTRVDDVFFLSNSHIMNVASNFLFATEKRVWEHNIFGEYLIGCGIQGCVTNTKLYAVLRPEALREDINNFNICFNVDREHYSPHTSSRLPV